MTPNLGTLVAAADAAKQTLAILTAANETAAQLSEQDDQRHKDTYAAVQKAADALQVARAAVDAYLDSYYGPVAPAPAQAVVEAPEAPPIPPAAEQQPPPVEQAAPPAPEVSPQAADAVLVAQ